MEPPTRGAGVESDSRRMPWSGVSSVGYPRGWAENGRCQRPRPASSRSQAATACSSRRAALRRAARAWLAEIEFACGPVPPDGAGGRGRRDPTRPARVTSSYVEAIERRHYRGAGRGTRTNWFVVRAVESAPDDGMRDRDPEALLGVREALVLAVVAVGFGVREHDDPVRRERRQRILQRDRRLRFAGVAGGVDALLLEPLDGLLLGGLGLGDRLVGVGDPERELRPVRRRRDDQHLGPLDVLAERRAQHVGVDRLGREDQQLHGTGATPGRWATNGTAPRAAAPPPAPGGAGDGAGCSLRSRRQDALGVHDAFAEESVAIRRPLAQGRERGRAVG